MSSVRFKFSQVFDTLNQTKPPFKRDIEPNKTQSLDQTTSTFYEPRHIFSWTKLDLQLEALSVLFGVQI